MTDRELKKLSRADLLELLLEQLKENEQLQAKLDAAQAQLDQREVKIEQAGSIAEAALQLNGVFDAAQAACAQYIENVEHLSAQTEARCAQLESQTRQRCEELERQTQQRCQTMETQSQQKCEQMLSDAKRQSQAYWDKVFGKVRELTSSYAELRTILQQAPGKQG